MKTILLLMSYAVYQTFFFFLKFLLTFIINNGINNHRQEKVIKAEISYYIRSCLVKIFSTQAYW